MRRLRFVVSVPDVKGVSRRDMAAYNGAIRIEADTLRPTVSQGYQPISSKEFNAAWGRLRKLIASLKP